MERARVNWSQAETHYDRSTPFIETTDRGTPSIRTIADCGGSGQVTLRGLMPQQEPCRQKRSLASTPASLASSRFCPPTTNEPVH